MTINQPSPSAAIFPAQGLPDEVTEILCAAADREGREFIVTWAPGERRSPNDESILSTMIDSPCASIGFVYDHRGVTWLTWQVHAGTASGARSIDMSDDGDWMVEFCYALLVGTHIEQNRTPTSH